MVWHELNCKRFCIYFNVAHFETEHIRVPLVLCILFSLVLSLFPIVAYLILFVTTKWIGKMGKCAFSCLWLLTSQYTHIFHTFSLSIYLCFFSRLFVCLRVCILCALQLQSQRFKVENEKPIQKSESTSNHLASARRGESPLKPVSSLYTCLRSLSTCGFSIDR